MNYPQVRYASTNHPLVLELHSYDGTFRLIVFTEPAAVQTAMSPVRAHFDCVAIDNGFLPHGAVLATSAAKPDTNEILGLSRDAEAEDDGLAAIRLGFSLDLLVTRSTYIDAERDAIARSARPREAQRYDRLLNAS